LRFNFLQNPLFAQNSQNYFAELEKFGGFANSKIF